MALFAKPGGELQPSSRRRVSAELLSMALSMIPQLFRAQGNVQATMRRVYPQIALEVDTVQPIQTAPERTNVAVPVGGAALKISQAPVAVKHPETLGAKAVNPGILGNYVPTNLNNRPTTKEFFQAPLAETYQAVSSDQSVLAARADLVDIYDDMARTSTPTGVN